MSFDGLFTHAIVNELRETLVGGKVSKIHQPFSNELLLRIRANRKNYNLFISAHSQYARVQLTNLTFENPQQAPQFCMVLRKYIENSTIVDIQQIENDRIVEITLTGRDELGDEQHYHLIVEIMGRHSNILLVNKTENKLYEAIKHISPSQNSYRTLLPGAEYRKAPGQESLNPFFNKIDFKIDGITDKEKVRAIQSQFQGVGRDSALEILHLIETHRDLSNSETLQKFLDNFRNRSLKPTLTRSEKKEYFTPLPYASISGEKEYFASLSDLLDEYYENKADRDRISQQTNDLTQLLNNERKKNEKKLFKLEKEYKETDRAEKYRIQGELLTAFMHKVDKGMEAVDLENFYQDNKIMSIELDPRKSPAENTQWYFNRYRKMQSREKHLASQIPITKSEITYIDSVLAHLEFASGDDIEEIREELREQGYLKKQRNKKKKNKKNHGPEKYYSSDGSLIYVGKNNSQNDELTMRTANKTDWWLHTKDIPGSHVLIRSDNPTQQTLEEAAILAAYNSKYRLSSSVPVDYTQIKNVRKPNGAKPGYVIYDNQQTLFVTPDKKKVRQLKENNANK